MMHQKRGLKAILVAVIAAIIIAAGLFAINNGTGTSGGAGSDPAVVADAEGADTEGTPEADAEKPAEADSEKTQDTAAAEESTFAYEDRQIPVFRETLTEETIPLRFYEDMPNVAYVKIEDYHHLFLPEDQVTVTETGEGTGIFEVTNGTGSAVIDTVNEKITSDDLSAFTDEIFDSL